MFFMFMIIIMHNIIDNFFVGKLCYPIYLTVSTIPYSHLLNLKTYVIDQIFENILNILKYLLFQTYYRHVIS